MGFPVNLNPGSVTVKGQENSTGKKETRKPWRRLRTREWCSTPCYTIASYVGETRCFQKYPVVDVKHESPMRARHSAVNALLFNFHTGYLAMRR